MASVDLVLTMQDGYFFHDQLWFPVSDRDSRRFEDDFRFFVCSCHSKIIVEEIESIMGTHAGMEFTLVSLYSTEIKRYRSCFLE